jgi:Replication initiator protein, pSAM2
MATAVQGTVGGSSPVVGQLLVRAADVEQWERFEHQVRSTGYCRRPVRLRGQVDAVDLETGECRTTYSTEPEPDRTLPKCCGNRREAVCASCAETYRGDAYELVAAGLRGGKGVPESVAEQPMLFATLTAPSFGPVHSRRLVAGRPQRCRPRRQLDICPHGVRLSCGEVHDEDDPRLGEPLCPDCFDYEHAVLWNALAPELWRRTAIQIPRELAALRGISERELRRRVRVSYVKVAEYQRRGALHFHCVIRLDCAQPRETAEVVEPPPAEFSRKLLIDAVRAAVGRVSLSSPTPDDEPRAAAREIRWGLELEVRPLEMGSSVEQAAACATYIAKYATKSTEAVGGLTHRLDAADLASLRVREHVRRYIQCAWHLGGGAHLHELQLRRWAHTLGFRGHCFTKSRRYSTTFTALRRARHEHVLNRLHPGGRRDPWGRPVSEGASFERRRFRFTGIGYRTPADAWLAECAAARAREQRRVAREELRTTPVGVVLEGNGL